MNDKLTLDENAKDDWIKLVKKHKKRQKGLPALSTLNTNAGNIEHNVSMFNKMNSPADGPSNNPISGPFGGAVSSGGEGVAMGESLTEALQTNSVYMLRNDGKVIFVEGALNVHPYVMQTINQKPFNAIRDLFITLDGYPLKWFFNNTQDEDTKLNIITLINSVLANCDYYGLSFEELETYRNTFNHDDDSVVNIFDLEVLFELLNQKTNQEFCRFRTSSKYSGGSDKDIYFRISSIDFNWFPLIWNFVYENKHWVKSVTIAADAQAGKEDKIYKHQEKLIDHVPVEEFVLLEGNPLIEKVDLQYGVKLKDAYVKGNPIYWVESNNSKLEAYVKNNFVTKQIIVEELTMNNETIELEYENIPVEVVTRRGNPSGYYDYGFGNWLPDDDETEERLIDWTYKVDKQDVIEFLQDDEDVQLELGIDELTDEEYDKKLLDNFDNLLDKYMDKVLEHFQEDAAEDAQENYEYEEDYPDYDPYDESIEKKQDKDLDDKFDMSMRTLL